ncbi:DUF6904 family protein [Bacillus piscicola]|uniref:DUF6904 family protein n=1 Tax=Bacillus piscicola TaxID=1632684 RepID=UPI001F08DBD0|nr:hypothetical protein [Bacillus piscicola]
MIYVKNTPNNTGVTVYGDYLDFETLYESLHTIVGNEDEWERYEGARLRVLAVCYDIRHSLMGDRDITFVDNGLDKDKMRYQSTIANEKNVYLSFNVLWPEILFVTMTLNDFVSLYAYKQVNHDYRTILDYRNIWDAPIARVRNFQAAIGTCIKETIPSTSINRVLRLMNRDYTWSDNYVTQYLDELNCRFIDMDSEKRLKNITIMAKRIAEKGREYQEVEYAVMEAAIRYKCHPTDLESVVEYPEVIEW